MTKANHPGLDESKLPAFLDFLNESWLGKKKCKHLLFLLDFISGKHPPELVSRSFLFEGEPGTGKTYLAERILETSVSSTSRGGL